MTHGSWLILLRKDDQLPTGCWLLQGERSDLPIQAGCTHEDREGWLAMPGTLIDTKVLRCTSSCIVLLSRSIFIPLDACTTIIAFLACYNTNYNASPDHYSSSPCSHFIARCERTNAAILINAALSDPRLA